ncbi:hypothetical protein LZ31DRAFT_156302 [Colletotrichum somersetense]|nr:hypothetical protein LZ31DRAFT_156302 [Colletotrichum somersetense]
MRDGKERKDIHLTWRRCDFGRAVWSTASKRVVISGGSRLFAPPTDSGGGEGKRKQASYSFKLGIDYQLSGLPFPSSKEGKLRFDKRQASTDPCWPRGSDGRYGWSIHQAREETLRRFVLVRLQDAHGGESLPWRSWYRRGVIQLRAEHCRRQKATPEDRDGGLRMASFQSIPHVLSNVMERLEMSVIGCRMSLSSSLFLLGMGCLFSQPLVPAGLVSWKHIPPGSPEISFSGLHH